MLTTAPHLTIRQPSPTTIEYTVSTVPPPTLATRLLLTTVATTRILTAFSLLLLLFSKTQQVPALALDLPTYPSGFPPLSTDETPLYLLSTLHGSSLGRAFSRAAEALPFAALMPLVAVLAVLTVTPLHTTESLLVLRGLGVQTRSSRSSYLSTDATRFIPTESIQDLFVNEVFRGFEVRYMLGVVVAGEEEVVVVFPRLLPGRAVVERVWRGGRACLWGSGNAAGVGSGLGVKEKVGVEEGG